MKTLKIHRHNIHLVPDRARVITRPLISAKPERVRSILNRALQLSEGEVEVALAQTLRDFDQRHRNIKGVWNTHFQQVSGLLPPGFAPTENRRLLIGSYFTCEYSIEGAALFNPSIVPHPDQQGLPGGSLRFILSLRATGEGHISSIEFRTGIIG
ncbi:MAG: glycosidase, partial [Bacteroidota bacterium]